MATKSSTQMIGSEAVATMAKQAVTATKSWNAAAREAAMSPLTMMTRWNGPMAAMVEPMVKMTRDTHERWLDDWESQSHHLIDQTFMVMEHSARAATGIETVPK